VVPTYNNAVKDRYLNNIKSIVMQDYKNYHIVVIDDASDDNTGGLINNYLASQLKINNTQYRIIRNTAQLKAMPNLRSAAKSHCRPEEIFLVVDGDDELLGCQVLKLFNSVFQEKKLWFVYSNFLSTTGGVGFSRPFPDRTIRRNAYRTYPFVTSHLRAFYTKLFTNIR
jgi:glycosyltransferase involved in cell wall biosynthesis